MKPSLSPEAAVVLFLAAGALVGVPLPIMVALSPFAARLLPTLLELVEAHFAGAPLPTVAHTRFVDDGATLAAGAAS